MKTQRTSTSAFGLVAWLEQTQIQSDYRDFAEKPMERDVLLRDPSFQSIAELGTGGGTELLPALRHTLGIHQRFSRQRRSHIVLITDGQVGNEDAALEEISGHALPIHCFGIDHAVNEAFLRQLSGQQRGTSVFLTPDDDLVRPVAILGSRLGRPVFTDLTLDGGWDLADTKLPDIHAGQVVFAPIRTKGNLSEINVAGKDAAGRPLTLANDFFDLKETQRLTEQLSRTIESVFCPPDAKKLTSIEVDWAKHTDETRVRNALCALLHECERERNTEHLRKVLSDFFLTLPDPWRTEAASIFAAQTPTLIRSAAASP